VDVNAWRIYPPQTIGAVLPHEIIEPSAAGPATSFLLEQRASLRELMDRIGHPPPTTIMPGEFARRRAVRAVLR
jgi:hypothetical protein